MTEWKKPDFLGMLGGAATDLTRLDKAIDYAHFMPTDLDDLVSILGEAEFERFMECLDQVSEYAVQIYNAWIRGE